MKKELYVVTYAVTCPKFNAGLANIWWLNASVTTDTLLQQYIPKFSWFTFFDIPSCSDWVNFRKEKSDNKFNSHRETLFTSLKLSKLGDILSVNTVQLYLKLRHGDRPLYITNYFTRMAPGITQYDLRPSSIFKTPTFHDCVAERGIRFMLLKV